jgi:hypothetical protein
MNCEPLPLPTLAAPGALWSMAVLPDELPEEPEPVDPIDPIEAAEVGCAAPPVRT